MILPPALLDQAVRRLAAGGLVAFPTETVYGLGGDATSDGAVAAIFAAKGRPRFNPLIAHVASLAAAAALVEFDERACALAERFWPGPLTLVLPRRPDSPLSLLVSAGLDSVAVRMPDHPVAQALLAAYGKPLAAPSANRSGAVSPTEAAHVAQSLGPDAALILDGGPCRVGVESTVLDLSGPVPLLLRPGGLAVETLEAVLGCKPGRPELLPGTAPRAPGMLASHYAPGLPVRLDAEEARPGEALLGFGPGPATLNLSPAGDTTEAAAHLFAMLRALDRAEFTAIAVRPIPESGLGLAINDRLRRAAAPRG
ncbi:L-threonylcarbamoyladenylate synthase [Phaeospirillum tilakii]|uniref:Threonylcarbamoyl-AMP synthase n=1 Tax=Phaeospirillum tilakii TaxID=741673 RepID=A0ABW5CC34_9PROT